MATRIRLITQSDTNDLPDTTCDYLLQEAWEHCAYAKTYWPFYRQTWTHTFTGDGSAYTFSSANLQDPGATGDATAFRPASPNAIEAVFDTSNDRQLAFVDAAEFNKIYQRNPSSVGDPRCYTVEQGQWDESALGNVGWDVSFNIKLWPIPSNAGSYPLVIEGYREPQSFVVLNEDATGTALGPYYDATAANAVPDMPVAFHDAILNYAIGLAFAFLDEGDRTLFFMTLCDNILAQQETVWFRAPSLDGPVILNGGTKRGVYDMLPARLRYDWE